jgi:sec-independent protein translocase protein TatC
MINKLPADDLFEKSSMTFGEHLEELRRALAKAMIWLGIGTALGLLLAERIVKFIETPLKGAITGYYVERAKLSFEEANGVKPSDELAAWMLHNNMQPQRAYVDPFTITDIANPTQPTELQPANQDGKTKPPPTDKPDAKDKDKTTEIDQSELVGKLEQNPWKDVDIRRLSELKPFILWQPIPNKLIALTSMEPFMMWMKAGIVAGIIFSSPGIFYHIWQFFAAGLYPHERRYVYWYLPLSLALFFAGVALAFFVIFKLVLQFLIGYTSSLDVEFAPRLNDYMTFAMMLPLGFGLAFQLPIVMLGLHRFGVITAETFLSQWRIAVLVISFLAMILTPADPYSMIGLAVPLIVLYFLGILLCHYMPKGAGFGSAAVDP